MDRVTILLLSKREIFSQGLAKLLQAEANIDVQVISSCSSPPEVIKKARELEPDIILIDAILEDGYIKVMQGICSQIPGAKVLVLTGYEEYRYILSLLLRYMAYGRT